MASSAPVGSGRDELPGQATEPHDDVEALRETLARMRTIAAKIPSMLAYWGADQRCRYANAAYERWFGVKPETLIGKTLQELLGPIIYPQNRPYILGALAGKPQHFEREIPDPAGGPPRYSQADYIPEIADRVVAGFVVLVSDITERRQLELRLEHAQEEARATAVQAQSVANRLERILSAMADGLIVQDAAGRVTSSNEAAQKILGLTKDEVPGAHPSDPRWRVVREDGSLFPVGERPPAVARRTGLRVDGVSMGIYKPDGSLTWVSVNCVPRVDPEGRVTETVTTLHDVTVLRNAIARASQQDRLAMAGVLAAGVGHEINNPLTYVVGNLDFALEELSAFGGPSPPARLNDLAALLREAREGADRIRKIVRGLRALSREEVALHPVEIGSAIEMARNIAAHELRHKATVAVRRGDDGSRALADESRLTQVLVNLLVNAAQAFERADPARNLITISTLRRPPDQVTITISDNGPGIPVNLRGRVFDPFFTTKPVGEGTGLGLSVSRTIMDSMGGELLLEASDDPGTTFELVLPVATEMGGGGAGSAPAPETGRRGRIAVVDDEPAVANMMRRILEREHEVVTFKDPQAALDALDGSQPFDVVFCDVMMPYMGGDELFRRVRASRPELADRFVFITGGQTNPSVQAFLSGIPNERVEKPFAAQGLLGIARRFVGLHNESSVQKPPLGSVGGDAEQSPSPRLRRQGPAALWKTGKPPRP